MILAPREWEKEMGCRGHMSRIEGSGIQKKERVVGKLSAKPFRTRHKDTLKNSLKYIL